MSQTVGMGRIPLSRESSSTAVLNAYWKLSEGKTDFLALQL